MNDLKTLLSKYGFSVTLIVIGLILTIVSYNQYSEVHQIVVNKRNKAFLEKFVGSADYLNLSETKNIVEGIAGDKLSEGDASVRDYINRVKGNPTEANTLAEELKNIEAVKIKILRPSLPTKGTIWGSVSILLAGIIVLLYSQGHLSTAIQYTLLGILALGAIIIFVMDYNSIDRDVQFQQYMQERKEAVVNRLLDIQEAQKKYKQLNKNYATSMDSLLYFIQNTKQPSLKKTPLKAVPKELDTLSEASLVAQGYLRIDTSYVDMEQLLYLSEVRMKKRNYRPFNLDSLRYVPNYRNGEGNLVEWSFSTDSIETNNTKRIAFQISDLEPIVGKTENDTITLKIGSLTESTANGNWSN